MPLEAERLLERAHMVYGGRTLERTSTRTILDSTAELLPGMGPNIVLSPGYSAPDSRATGVVRVHLTAT